MNGVRVVTAGEIGYFKGGSGFPLRFQGTKASQLPFFKVSDMNKPGNELFMRTANNYVSEAARKQMGATRIPAGAIVFAKVGAAIFLERKRILAQESCIDNNMAAFIVESSEADVRFIHYLLSEFKFSDLVATTALPSLNGGQLRSISLRLPGLQEQQEIVIALNASDELISRLECLIAKKRDVKRGLMQELLTGRTRLPGYSGPWKVGKLGDVAYGSRGAGLSKSSVSATGLNPCLLYGELFTTYDRVIESVSSFTDEESGAVSVGGEVLLPGSTTTVAEDLAIASALLQPGVQLGGDINIIRPNRREVDSVWLAYYLTSQLRREIADAAQGITIIHLYVRSLLTLGVDLPPLREQIAIAGVLRDADLEIAALERRLESARAIKQGMMQELLTGRTRLTEEVAA